MRYYSETEMRDTRLALEETILDWPEAGTKKMFGCPCFLAGGKLFAILVTRGIVLTRLDENDRNVLAGQYRSAPFVGGKKIMPKWSRVPVNNTADLREILPFVKKSYKKILAGARIFLKHIKLYFIYNENALLEI